jgi:ubiquinone/menaquinone biosynthesis C-methylase UbiE
MARAAGAPPAGSSLFSEEAGKMLPTDLQPDQQPARWDDYVDGYEAVFEPFTLQFARAAVATLGLTRGQSVLDVGAGSGGAALAMAEQGLKVTAIDASPRMVERILARAAERGVPVDAQAMDGQALQFADASFDAALSVLGIILFPDAERGLAQMRRVVRPGGPVSVVTWTEPQNYELAAELRAAIQSVRPQQPPAPLPAQLRYREEADFRALFEAAGLSKPEITTVTARLEAPSARWLAERIGFAPGMAAMMAGLGERAPAVMQRFVENLDARRGAGPISLSGVAFVGTARVP